MKTLTGMLGIVLVLGLASLAPAADYIWDGGGAAGVWDDADNWGGGGYPDGNGDTAVIDSGSDGITIPAGKTLGALTLDIGYSGTVSMAGNLLIDDAGGKSGDLTLNAGTLQTGKDVTSGITADGTFTIAAGATGIVRRSSTAANGGHGAGQTITVGALTVDGTLTADRQGFDSGGPGAPGWGSGASHGGVGGDGDNAPGPTYGSLENPVSLGTAASGSGGGSIVISSTGTVSVAGFLTADAQDVNYAWAPSGGSINITAGELTGTGVISADGGDNAAGGRGAGGGGRIGLNGVGAFSFTGTLRANGGQGTASSAKNGHAGTIYLNAALRSSLTLGGAGNLASLRLGSDGLNDYTLGAVTIQNGGRLEIDGNRNLNGSHGGAATLHLTTLDVQSGGVLSADGLGFDEGNGPAPAGYKKGAGHGGEGGHNGGAGGASYGSLTNPVSLGSAAYSQGGGGAVILDVSGTVTVNGTISANGPATVTYGAAAGGCVNIRAQELSGTGEIQANGGNGTSNNNDPSGGGGRVAVVLTTGTDFGSVTIEAAGGTDQDDPGAAGTVYLRDADDAPAGGELVVNNPHTTLSAIFTELPPELDALTFSDELAHATMIVTNYGRVALTTNLNVGDLYLHDNGVTNLFLNGWTLYVDTYYHDDWGHSNLVEYAGGTIEWKAPPLGTLFMLR